MKDEDKNYFSDDYELVALEEYRTRKRLSIFPWIVTSGFNGDYHWTGKWFTFVSIKEQKVKIRYTEFDSGWSYQNYWTPWKESWYFLEVVI
jgi:hypothetical protein